MSHVILEKGNATFNSEHNQCRMQWLSKVPGTSSIQILIQASAMTDPGILLPPQTEMGDAAIQGISLLPAWW